MKVIVINGPMGVGKTTVGKAIAERYPGTAFIDGDWCMDLHPFVGSAETRAMAVDNILHMTGNYLRCSACKMVVLVWLMDDPRVCRQITDGISALEFLLPPQFHEVEHERAECKIQHQHQQFEPDGVNGADSLCRDLDHITRAV